MGELNLFPIHKFSACLQLIDQLYRYSPRPRRRWSPAPLLWSRTSPVAPGPRGCRSLKWNVSRPSQECLQLWCHGRYHALLSGPNRSSPTIYNNDCLCNRRVFFSRSKSLRDNFIHKKIDVLVQIKGVTTFTIKANQCKSSCGQAHSSFITHLSIIIQNK